MKQKHSNKSLIHRYKIASGHLKKVIKMIETGEYCIDVIHQSLAVQAALKKADQEVLENHLNTCVSDAIRRGNKKEVISEVMKVVRKI